jgi:hypothetical protein
MCNKLKLQTKEESHFVSDQLHFRLSRKPRKIPLISIMWKVVIKRIPYKQVFWGGSPFDMLASIWPIVPALNDECGAVGGMRIGWGSRSTQRKPFPCHFVHYKSHMT